MTYLTMKGFNKTTPPTKTFTISRTEQSNMSSGWTYSDDATWLTAGDGAFDDFFWYSAVLLNTSWVETAEMTQSWWVFTGAMSTLGNITSGDNVMIKFPVRGIKMSKSWSVVTLSITDGIGRESEWFQYYAFQNTWDINANILTTVETKPLYIWAYLGYLTSSTLKSWSGKTPTSNYSFSDFLTYAWNNWTWWTIIWFYQRMLIDAYYMMKYGNPNSQSVIWYWYVWGSSATSTWWTNSQTNATYWSPYSTTANIKLFWIEDRWGNLNEWTWWAFRRSWSIYTALHDFTASTSTSQSQYKNAWWTYDIESTSNNIYSIIGDSKWMFVPYQASYNTSYNTYYCDYTYMGSNNLCVFGGTYSWWNYAGIFHTAFSWSYDSYSWTIGTRLMYL